MMLVSLEQAKAHLRTDTDDGDGYITSLVQAASSAVMGYIVGSVLTAEFTDSAGDPLEDSNGIALDIPEDVQHATLFLVGIFWMNRGSDEGEMFDGLFLPKPVRSLLIRYREPTLA